MTASHSRLRLPQDFAGITKLPITPFPLPWNAVIDNCNGFVVSTDVLMIEVGECVAIIFNGIGKSTLLRTLLYRRWQRASSS
jgi:hypothetical protein